MGLSTPEKVWEWFRAAQDEAAASGRRGGTVETEAQLQELAQEIGRQELALEQLTEGDSIAGQLTSEQLGRLALAMQEARGEAAQNLRPAERAPTQNEAQEMQKLQLALDWENGTGELTEGGIDGKVEKNGNGPDYYVSPKGMALPAEYQAWLGTNQRDQYMNAASDEYLKKIIGEIFRPGAFIGDGGTADSIRFERETGLLLCRSGHMQKGQDMMRCLERMLSTVDGLSENDQMLIEMLISELKSAMEGK